MEPRLLAVESAVRQLRPRQQAGKVYELPFWECMALGDGVAPTATTFPEFDDRSRTDRVAFRVPTAGGELFLHQWELHCPMRAAIGIRALIDFSAPVMALADGTSTWWHEHQGIVTAHTTSETFSIAMRAGFNLLRVFKDHDNTDRLLWLALLFDNVNAFFVPPSEWE